jgi:hypothetical protein
VTLLTLQTHAAVIWRRRAPPLPLQPGHPLAKGVFPCGHRSAQIFGLRFGASRPPASREAMGAPRTAAARPSPSPW